MTPEQIKHQEEYYRAKRNYENASIEKRRAENEIIRIRNRRTQIINKVNGLNSEKRRNETSLAEINKTSARNNDIDVGIKDGESKLSTAAAGFLAIGESSVGNPQNLVDVFDDKNRISKAAINGAFEQMKRAATSISRKIEELISAIRRLETEMEEGKRREHSLSYVASQQQRIMNNASIEMAYHKRHMTA